MNVFRTYNWASMAKLACSSALAIFLTTGAFAQAPTLAPAPGGFDKPPARDVPMKPGPPPVTLYKPIGPTRPANAEGFLQRWLVLEPIPANGLTDNAVQAIVKKDYFPGQYTVIPHDGDKVTVGNAELTWHELDTKSYNFDLYHFANAIKKPTTNVLFWVVTIVDSPREMQDVRLAIGSNAASVWWLNGKEVIDIYGDRQTVIDDGVSKRLTLNKGPNVLRVAVVNGGGATDFCARFLDAADKPIKDLTVNLSGDRK